MESYKLLSKYKYGSDGRNRKTENELEDEYQKRITSFYTVVTNLHPLLVNKHNLEMDKNLKRSPMESNYPIFWVTTPEMIKLTNNILTQSKSINELTNNNNLPNIAIESYLKSLLTSEIFFTNEIEGVHTNPEEIETIIWKNEAETKLSRRLESTIRKYQTSLSGEQHQINTLEDIKRVYDQLLDGEIQESKKPDGLLFRNSFVYIGNSSKTVHLPPDNEQKINKALLELILFMNDDDITTPLIKSIVTHFMFENTHPFLDGNGRTGRYLLSSYISNKIDSFTGLTISTAIHNHVQKYYKLFQEAGDIENRGDVTYFIIGMLKIISDGQKNVINQLKLRGQNLDKNFENINLKYPDLTNNKKSILYLLLQSKLFTNDSLNSGIQDREIEQLLHENDGISRRDFKEAIAELENKEKLIKTLKKRPLQHTIVDEILVKN